ncbi:MAG: ferrochelatase [Isosphaeraceae bacterium]
MAATLTMDIPHDSVLLLAYGGPERIEDVRPFLDNILRGRPVSRERYEAVVHHYELMGGRSPLNDLTSRQAEGLRAALAADGPALPVYFGMRFAPPFLYTVVRDMIRDGRRRAVAIVMAPYRSAPSFEYYQNDLQSVLDAAGPGVAPLVDWVDPWFDHPLFAEAQADQVRRALSRIPDDRRDAVRLIFTAHSIPIRVANLCPYAAQIEAACTNTARHLDGLPWQLAWQSRSGDGQTPWLEPDVNDVLRLLKQDGVADVVLCPIGFISDHVEVLYDLDIEAAQTCRDLGLTMTRAESVNDHPTFALALADLVRSRMADGRRRTGE